jgi:hypothetical protein
MTDRWALLVDVEGFGAKWDDTMEAFRGLNALMQAIYWIGERAYREPPERLFAHQFGDGFLLVSDFHEDSLSRAALVGLALLRYVLSRGATAKAALAEGDLSDIVGCYPEEIRRQPDRSHIVFGSGVMTVFPVMGTALINAVALAKRSPSGPLFTVDSTNRSRLPADIPIRTAENGVLSLNWLSPEIPALDALQTAAGMARYSKWERLAQLRAYISKNNGLSERWRHNAEHHLLHDI